MLKQTHKSLLLSAFALGITTLSFGQTLLTSEPSAGKVNSPYNRYGIGSLRDGRSAGLKAMGGISTGYVSSTSINSYNPASYGFLARTNFEFAIEGASNKISMGDQNFQSGSFTINHLNFAFPILNSRLGFNLGFEPLTNNYYYSGDTVDVTGLGRTLQIYKGTGNLQVARIGLGGGIKNLKIGANVGYIFGTTNQSTYINYIDTANIGGRNTEYTAETQTKGLELRTGLLYRIPLPKDQYINLGATAKFGQTMHLKTNDYFMAGTGSGTTPTTALTDTIYTNDELKSTYKMPTEYAIGIHYGKYGNYNLGVDYTYTDWKEYKTSRPSENYIADKSQRAAFGFEITPNPNAKKGQYLSAVAYRVGAYYGQDYLSFNGKQIEYFAGTFGLNLPLRRFYDQFGSVNTTFDIGQRGTTVDGLAKEFFVKFTLGFNFSDRWFKKTRWE